MKNYFITFEVAEGVPDYDFVIRAKTEKSAQNIARKIIMQDYPMEWEIQKGDFGCSEITAEQLLKQMTLN
jgi:hypothetical protein